MTRSALVRLLFSLVLVGMLIGSNLSALVFRRGAFAADASALDLASGYAMIVLALIFSVLIGRIIVLRAAGPAQSPEHVA